MENKKNDRKNEIMLEISPAVEGGVYTNLANIIHNRNEFIIDFAIVLPGRKGARVQSRIITNPIHAKQLMLALQDNVAKFEAVNGEIEVEPPPTFPRQTQTIN